MAAHLSPSAIFSPSVARQQLATAKDWNYIDSWLSAKLGGKTPSFERNNETLKAFLAIAAVNESADEERDLIAQVEVKALHDLQAEEESDPNTHLLDLLEDSLTGEGQTSLEALATLVEMIGKPPVANVEDMGHSIIDLQVTLNDLDQASERITVLENYLKLELERMNGFIKEIRSNSYQAPSDVMKQTLNYQRKTKVLASKLPELRDRLASLTTGMEPSKTTIMDIKAEENGFKGLMATVRNLEAQVKGFHGLPHDTDLARLELEGVRVELLELTRQRDSMFEGLVERESPKKTRSQK